MCVVTKLKGISVDMKGLLLVLNYGLDFVLYVFGGTVVGVGVSLKVPPAVF